MHGDAGMRGDEPRERSHGVRAGGLRAGLVIDADGHVMEPFEIWRELPEPYRSVAPRLVSDDRGDRFAFGDLEVELDVAPGDFATPGGFRAGSTLGRRFDEIHPGAFDPTARLALLDEQGIDVTYLYPTFLLNLDMHADGMRQAMNEVYDDWVSDFCATDPQRLRWVAPISRNDLDHAVREVERAARLGASAIFLSPVPTNAGMLLGDPAEDRLYGAIAETGLGLAVHASDPWNSTLAWRPILPTRWMWDCGSASLEMQFAMIWVFGNGLLDRFPTLRVGFFEGNLGWFPYLIQKMGMSYEHFGALFPAPARSPLETFRERCWISGETEEPLLPMVVDLIGADRCLWASDFPHHEATWDPVEELEEAPLSDLDRRAMAVTAPQTFYGR